MTERRLVALDELRGLAISAVILSHVALVYRDDSTIAFGLAMPALGVGVDLFFVISGFVIFENATRMIARAPQNFWRGAGAFWIRRAIRIALPAWATVAAIAAMQGASGAHGASIGDLAAAAGFYADFHWGNCWAGADVLRGCPGRLAFLVARCWKCNFTRWRRCWFCCRPAR